MMLIFNIYIIQLRQKNNKNIVKWVKEKKQKNISVLVVDIVKKIW